MPKECPKLLIRQQRPHSPSPIDSEVEEIELLVVLHSELDTRLADVAAGGYARQEQGFKG